MPAVDIYYWDNKNWQSRIYLLALLFFSLIRISTLFKIQFPFYAHFLLIFTIASLSIFIPLSLAFVGIFDALVWLVIFTLLTVGFIFLPVIFVYASITTIFFTLVLVSFYEKYLPINVRVYAIGENSFVSNFSDDKLTMHWIFMFIVLLVVTNIIAYLTNNWHQRETELRIISEIDELTGVMNRRSILDYLRLGMRKTLERDSSLSIAILDLDYFKKINDTYGHP